MSPAMACRRFITLAVALNVAVASTVAPAAPTTQPDIQSLIASLADRDPRARASASKELAAVGVVAREALTLAATDDPDPEVRSRAAAILAGLPLTRPGDPAAVRRRLEQYRKADPATRQQLISGEWAQQQDGDTSVAVTLLRIVSDATSESDRWLAAGALEKHRDAATRRLIRDAAPKSGSNLPLLLITADAWSGRKHERANELYERAVQVAAETGVRANAEVEAAFDTLAEQAYLGRRYGDLVKLCRQRAALEEPALASPDVPTSALDRLLLIHATYGPFDGFCDDLVTLGRAGKLTTPIAIYAGANLVRRAQWPVLAEAVSLVALASGDAAGALGPGSWSGVAPAERDWDALLGHGPTAQRRLAVGQLLMSMRQDHWAARELRAILRQRRGATGDPIVAAAHQRLAILAIDAARYTDAADHIDAAIEQFQPLGAFVRVDRNGRQFSVPAEMLSADAALQRLRAARLAGDNAEIVRQVDLLMNLNLADGDMVNELIPVLRRLNRNGEAQNLFDRYYALYKSLLDNDPDHPEYLNNLAWLCGRSAERPEEAIELIQKALKTDPNNAAYLDTAAEAWFRTGDAKRAAELERKALQRRSADVFMQEQLRRFELGIAKQDKQ
jgi:tetratricopeptide (TPR) repeat protein